ncbi:MAG: alpha/beta hydrolase [Pseudomonadota bacterium]
MPFDLSAASPLADRAPGVLPQTARHLRLTLPGGRAAALTAVPGQGEPVLWLHPSRTCRRVFDHAIAASRLGRPILVPDLCGHGDGDRPQTPHGLNAHVDDLVQIVEALGLDRFAIVGQATGATLGVLLATRLPRRVGALALGDIAMGLRPSVVAMVEAQERRFAAHPFATPQDAMAATPFSERWPPQVRAHWLATALHQAPDGWRWRYDPATVLRTMRDMLQDRWDEMDVAAPTLLFRGAENTAIERREIDRGLARLPNAEAQEMPGADHRLCQDAPEAFARIADAFLAGR